jgi:ubiquinone/menaquinone biosynthesis C-methylase UbiE
MNQEVKKYNDIYEMLYQKGYHGKMNFTHSESLIVKAKEFLPEGSKLLDIGCSNGTCVKMLQDSNYDSCGIDISETAISIATERGSKNCVIGSATKIPFEDNYVDGIICSDVFRTYI